MNNIKQHVPQLSTCKRMRELGWEKETLFWWSQSPVDSKWSIIYYEDKKQLKKDFIADKYDLHFAPLASEIGEELAKDVKTYWTGLEFRCEYDKRNGYAVSGDNETEIRAKMWIYLKESKLI